LPPRHLAAAATKRGPGGTPGFGVFPDLALLPILPRGGRGGRT